MRDTQQQAVYGTELINTLPKSKQTVKFLLGYFTVLFVGGLFLAIAT